MLVVVLSEVMTYLEIYHHKHYNDGCKQIGNVGSILTPHCLLQRIHFVLLG